MKSVTVSDALQAILAIIGILSAVVGVVVFLFRTFKTRDSDDGGSTPLVVNLQKQVDGLQEQLRLEKLAREEDRRRFEQAREDDRRENEKDKDELRERIDDLQRQLLDQARSNGNFGPNRHPGRRSTDTTGE